MVGEQRRCTRVLVAGRVELDALALFVVCAVVVGGDGRTALHVMDEFVG